MQVLETRKRWPLILLAIIFCYCKQSLAQTGYNYARTADGLASTRQQVAAAPANSLRPIVPVAGFPTAANAFPTAAASTAFGATANPAAAAAFAAFPGQPQQAGATTGTGLAAAGLTPSAANFGGSSLLRPVPTSLPQRTAGGIFGPGQTQFTTGGLQRAALNAAQNRDDSEDSDFSAIPGLPGVNYPVYSQIPQTNFDCGQQPLPGYYADVEALCQVFHICAQNRTYSFLCPNGTIFNQETLVCVWWNQYDCATAPSFYANNAYIYDYSKVGAPTAAGYQANQLSINVAAAANAARQQQQQQQQITAVNLNSGRLPTAPGGIFGARSADFTGLPGSTRFPPTPTAAAVAQAFPTGAAANAASFGIQSGRSRGIGAGGVTAAGSTVGGGAGGGGIGAGEATFANAALTGGTANRAYLPPLPRRN